MPPASPRRLSPSKSPPKMQQLRNPLLQRNRTQSQASYQGNTIDMVRIVRKNQQSRLSLINIDRRQYLNHQQPNNHQWRHSQMHPSNNYQPEENHEEEPHLSSTFVHQGTEKFCHKSPQLIEHYIRPSNVNLLNSINQQSSNKVLGLTLFCVFLVLFGLQTLVSSYFLYACHVIFGHFDYVLVLNYELYDEVFDQIEKGNFLPVLILYLGVDCVYHLVIFMINMYTNGRYKLIDRQTSRLSYILKHRDLPHPHLTRIQQLTRSPKFTIFLILAATALHYYALIHCYYYNQLNFTYVYFLSSPIVTLLQIFYFSVILPETWRYLFFEKMHARRYDQAQQSQSQGSSRWRVHQLTDFMIENWWIRLAIGVLVLSFVYSVVICGWLIVVSFAKIQISFKKMKYKIDTFYLEFAAKLMFLGIAAIMMCFQTQSYSLITFDYAFQCLILIPFALILTRILAHVFLRQQLYKYLYSEMNINIGNIFFAFGAAYLVTLWMGEYQFFSWDVIAIGVLCLGLGISLYAENSHSMEIKFNEAELKSEGWGQQMRVF